MNHSDEPNIKQQPGKSQDDPAHQDPPQKKTKISHQPRLFDMDAPRKASASSLPYSTARARKAKIFSQQEIEESKSLQSHAGRCGITKLRNFVGPMPF